MRLKLAALLAPLLALLFAGSSLITTPAMADIIQGPYLIEARYPKDTWSGATDYAGCVFVGENGKAERPSLFDGGAGATHLCGQPTGPINQAAIWDIYAVADSESSIYVIRNRFSGKCLIRGDGGKAKAPMLFRWPDSADTTYCGLPSLGDFMKNGQAAWNLNMKDIGLDSRGLHMFEGSITMSKPQQINLDILPLPLVRPVLIPGINFPTFSTDPSVWKFRLRTITQYP